MTRTRGTRTRATSRTGRWALQDAKARFSEVVRKAKTEGPQRITVHGREEVVVISVEEYRRVKGQPTGQALVKLLHLHPAKIHCGAHFVANGFNVSTGKTAKSRVFRVTTIR